ncbi:dienelactone hydrolase-related enzyme [Mesorhizobium sp. M4B.F.Ca.ET.190.01.1.1]|uniref:RcgR family putative quorum lactone hydrolase n=1 Tax=unclassified Mesorhizobium TaxID=325217 RepID=UPI0010918A87|nr:MULTISPECIES: dienelactone hydrolase-related enzyme [unclassified Mesorhizobium]TGR00947.1 dienelactone hydrolase-related enzyme [Mesorhizobium sp. M4B.F.Ca.ET.200.01.1.1]TGS12664.1 dienelactone hydrolase-related enzyme [Mesorhizobium sp. M4B.F.Ca.ET.190.01.1.1]TGT25289.1 dienelactone hydrolase-related enzyme [Mesorhizobium sp. M4B.F.Ca.ET.172.01.1.1]
MYHSWLDRWDEQRARRGEEGKKTTDLVLDAERAFPGARNVASIEEFCVLADQAVADPAFFDEPSGSDQGFEREDGWLKFPSDIATDIAANNVVWAKITESGSFDQAMVIFHHWNASSRNRQIANFFSRRGITVVEIAMPYHLERSRPGSVHADYMLSPNLGRTIQSVRQGVLDGRKLIRWLKREGYRKVSVLGMSLGSWVAALIAAHDSDVSKASLFLTAGSLADMVWIGRATRLIRDSLEPEIELTNLRRAWGPLNLENYANSLARPDLDLHVVLAKRDKVVLPKLSERFMQRLKDAGARPNILELNCGHYSLAIPPYILLAGLGLRRFLS